MSTPSEPLPSGTGFAMLDAFAEVTDTLSRVDLTGLSAERLVSFLQHFEQIRNQLQLCDHAVVAAATRVGLPETLVVKDTAAVLTSRLRLSRREALARVRAADELDARVSMSGESLPAPRPALAAAAGTGLVPSANRDAALRCLHELQHDYAAAPEVLGRAETSLAEFAPLLPADQFLTVCRKIVDVEFPDGRLDDRAVEGARKVSVRPRRDGSYALSGELTGECGAQLTAVLDSLARPAPSDSHDGEAARRATTDPSTRDMRTSAQRRHDALQAVCARLLADGGLPAQGGVPTSVYITVALDDLLAGQGAGTTEDGQRLSLATVQRLMDQAMVFPTVIDSHGRVHWQGAKSRCATPQQTHVLRVRDGGCSFPDCTVPASWCQRHHVVAWADGGPTRIDNLTLICGFHHRQFADRGWSCRLIDGLPHWIPPAGVGNDRTPRLHSRFRTRTHFAERSRRRKIVGPPPDPPPDPWVVIDPPADAVGRSRHVAPRRRLTALRRDHHDWSASGTTPPARDLRSRPGCSVAHHLLVS